MSMIRESSSVALSKGNQVLKVPFNRPSLVGTEQRYMQEAIQNGHISGDGPFTERCHRLLREIMQVERVLLTTSCTHALEMCALLLDFQPGDEVIVPSFTFVSSANAFVLMGGVPVFVDIRPDTLNIDEELLEQKITPRTKAVVCVHYAGVSCEMDRICDLARLRNITVIEDNAHGLCGFYKDQALGSLGDFATQSFHETKNFSCGEGGALAIRDMAAAERAEIVREKGTNRKKFFRGQVDKYSWVDTGSSYLPSDLLAAYLYAQLESRSRIQSARQKVWTAYSSSLTSWAHSNHVRLPFIPTHCRQSFHMFYLIMPDLQTRQRFISHMKSRGVLSVFHYLPLNASPMGLKLGGKPGDCPIAENISDRLVRLPLFNDMSEPELNYVIDSVLSF